MINPGLGLLGDFPQRKYHFKLVELKYPTEATGDFVLVASQSPSLLYRIEKYLFGRLSYSS